MGASAIVAILLLGAAQIGDRSGLEPQRGRLKISPSKTFPSNADQLQIDGDLSDVFKQLLLRADENDQIGQLFALLRTDPKLAAQVTLLRQLQGRANGPVLRKELLDLVAKYRRGEFSPKDLEALKSLLEGVNDQRRAIAENSSGSAEPTAEERFTDWLKDVLTDLDEGGLGDFLRDSPAWQDALRSLEQSISGVPPKLDWLGRAPLNWKQLDLWRPSFEGWSAKMPSLPELPSIRLNPPNLGRFNLNLGGPPRFSPTSISDLQVSDQLLWTLALLLIACLAWYFYRKLAQAPAALQPARRRPWPVDPSSVTTRTQLIQAFDHVALLRLGDKVRTWNHLAVADKLSLETAGSPSAGALAHLYELARYTPGDDLLSPEVQTAARRHLLLLAGETGT